MSLHQVNQSPNQVAEITGHCCPSLLTHRLGLVCTCSESLKIKTYKIVYMYACFPK